MSMKVLGLPLGGVGFVLLAVYQVSDNSNPSPGHLVTTLCEEDKSRWLARIKGDVCTVQVSFSVLSCHWALKIAFWRESTECENCQ